MSTTNRRNKNNDPQQELWPDQKDQVRPDPDGYIRPSITVAEGVDDDGKEPTFKDQVCPKTMETIMPADSSSHSSDPQAAAGPRPTRDLGDVQATTFIPLASQVRLVPDDEVRNNSNNNEPEEKSSVNYWKWIVILIGVLLLVAGATIGGVCGTGNCGGSSSSSSNKSSLRPPPATTGSTTTLAPTPATTDPPATVRPTVETPAPTSSLFRSCSDTIFPFVLVGNTTEGGVISGETMPIGRLDAGRTCGSFSGSNQPVNGAWYKVLGTGGILSATTCSSATDFPTAVAVYTGDCSRGNAKRLVCETGSSQEDMSCSQGSGFAATVEWLSSFGQVYYLFVQGRFPSSDGKFGLRMTIIESPMEFDIYKGHAYALSREPYQASRAKALTSTENGLSICGHRVKLASVNSQGENNFIKDLASSTGFILLGGFQNSSVQETSREDYGRGWSWINGDGSFPGSNPTNGTDAFQNWDYLEPDQRPGSGEEDCLTMYTGDGTWHDRTCDSPENPFRFVVEANVMEDRPVFLDNCDTGFTGDPVLDIQSGDSGYECTYLSDGLAGLVSLYETGVSSASAFRNSIDDLVASLHNEGTISLEEATAIQNCASSVVESL